eukprot:m.336990 g.336990  ORF g.336990 m.336990 type:complete len:295 (-) comp20543_c0_seq18:587-1471(-)
MSMADPVIKSHLVLGRPRMTRTQIIAEAQECFASSDATVLGQTLEYFVLAHGSDIVVCERVPTMRQRDAIASAAAMPTALHPLCDSLWISEYGVHGLELFRMFYICPGQTPSDRIRLLRLWRTGEVDQVSPAQEAAIVANWESTGKLIALKICGDPNVPSGRVTWITDVPPLLPEDGHVDFNESTVYDALEDTDDRSTGPAVCRAWAFPPHDARAGAATATSHIQLNWNHPPGAWDSFWARVAVLVRHVARHHSIPHHTTPARVVSVWVGYSAPLLLCFSSANHLLEPICCACD